MELLFIISIFLLMSGATLYLLVCIDPNSPGILGKLNRFVFGVLPNLLR
jgi:palmitoyltransferase